MKKIILILLIVSTVLFSSVGNKVQLTQEEENFIKNHPTITLGGGSSFEPFLIENADGTISGYDVDIVNLIKEKTGLNIQFKLGVWNEIQKEAKERLLDGLSTSGRGGDRAKYYNFSNQYMKYSALVIVNEGNPKKIYTPKDIEGKSVAVQRGNIAFTNLAKSMRNVEIVYYESMHDLIKAVVSKEVDFTIIDETAFYIAKEIGLEAFIEHSFIVGDTTDLIFNLRNDWPELISIVNKGLNAISKKEKMDIRDKWIGSNIKINNEDKLEIFLNEEEKKYLNNKKVINMCIDPNWAPFTKLIDGKQVGISADIYKLISKQISIPINLIKTNNWNETLEFAKQRKCDILDLAIETPSRKKYLNFTSTYIDIPLIIVTKLDVPFVYDFKTLEGKNIAIPNGYAFVEILKNKYPYLNIVEVKNIQDGLQRVKEGKVFGYVGTLASVAYVFKKNFTGELKITGRFNESFSMGSAVRSDDFILLNIIQKVINSIAKEDIENIVIKWINIKYEKSIDYRLIWQIVGLFSTILIIVLFFYIRQVKLKNELKNKEKELKLLASIDPLTKLYNRRYFSQAAKHILDLAKRDESDLSIMMIDIDKFKSVNDTYGHKFGDDVLIALAVSLEKNSRKSDVICRFGGEEFIILLPKTSMDGAKIIAEKIRKNVEVLTVDNKEVNFTVSIGVSQVDVQTESNIEIAIMRADSALYEAKNSGKNRVCIN